MSFPENENKQIGSEGGEFESTIFADPEHYNDKPREATPKGKKPIIVRAVALVLALGIAVGGYFAIDRLIPEEKEPQESGGIATDVLTVDTAYIQSVSIKNENTQYTILQKRVESADASETLWSIKGIKSDYTDSSMVEKVVDKIANIDALRTLTDDGRDFGFQNAAITVEVKGDGEKVKDYTVTFGDNAPADMGCYCKISGDEKVYIVDKDVALELQKEPIEFAVTTGYKGVTPTLDNAEYFSDGRIFNFDYISVSGAKQTKPLVVKPQLDDAINAYFAYIITSPTKRIANDEQVATLIGYFESGIASVGAYSYEKSDKTLKKYGLDKPDYVVTISMGGKKNTFKFTKQDELHCALIDSSTGMIHKVPVSTLSICNNKTEDYYSTFIILETLSGLKQMSVVTPDKKTYNFDLKYTAADDEKDIKQKYQAFYNGKELEIDNFKRYYQKLIALTPISYESKSGLKTVAKITLKHSANIKDVVLTFKKYSSQRYQVELDGIPMGLITASAFNELMEDTPKVAKGETINE